MPRAPPRDEMKPNLLFLPTKVLEEHLLPLLAPRERIAAAASSRELHAAVAAASKVVRLRAPSDHGDSDTASGSTPTGTKHAMVALIAIACVIAVTAILLAPDSVPPALRYISLAAVAVAVIATDKARGPDAASSTDTGTATDGRDNGNSSDTASGTHESTPTIAGIGGLGHPRDGETAKALTRRASVGTTLTMKGLLDRHAEARVLSARFPRSRTARAFAGALEDSGDGIDVSRTSMSSSGWESAEADGGESAGARAHTTDDAAAPSAQSTHITQSSRGSDDTRVLKQRGGSGSAASTSEAPQSSSRKAARSSALPKVAVLDMSVSGLTDREAMSVAMWLKSHRRSSTTTLLTPSFGAGGGVTSTAISSEPTLPPKPDAGGRPTEPLVVDLGGNSITGNGAATVAEAAVEWAVRHPGQAIQVE